jgi:hypothetical protein
VAVLVAVGAAVAVALGATVTDGMGAFVLVTAGAVGDGALAVAVGLVGMALGNIVLGNVVLGATTLGIDEGDATGIVALSVGAVAGAGCVGDDVSLVTALPSLPCPSEHASAARVALTSNIERWTTTEPSHARSAISRFVPHLDRLEKRGETLDDHVV